MSLPPGVGRRLPPPDTGPLPAAHTDASHHLSDVSGPPAPPSRAPDAPMAGPRTVGGGNAPAQRAPGSGPLYKPTLNGGPDRPPSRAPGVTVAPRPGGGGRTLGPKQGR